MTNKSLKGKALGALTLVASGAVGVALTFGSLVTSQDVQVWRKVGQTIYPVPSSLNVNMTSGDLTSATTTTETLTTGGDAMSTSTAGTTFGTLSESQLLNNTQINLTPNVTSATSSLSASSTWATLLANTADKRTWTLRNATSTSSITVGIAQTSGIDIVTNIGRFENVQIPPDGKADLTCERLPTTDILCEVDIKVKGD